MFSWLREKVASYTLSHMGFHPIDAHRMKSSNMEYIANVDERGRHPRPAIRVNGVATKRPGQKVRNYFVCGCPGPHDSDNDMCEYALADRLLNSLGKERSKRSLFWTTNSRGRGWGATPQKKDTLAQCFQKINKRCGIAPGKQLRGDQGRKTFVTLGEHFFFFPRELMTKVTHHKQKKNLIKYIDSDYENIARETAPARMFQSYEQGHYVPPVCISVPHGLSRLEHKVNSLIERIEPVIQRVEQDNNHQYLLPSIPMPVAPP